MPDEWTVASADGGLTAHFEHSIAVTENGPFILTAPDEESTTLSGRNEQQQV
jgi:methionyl aminopeptidase